MSTTSTLSIAALATVAGVALFGGPSVAPEAQAVAPQSQANVQVVHADQPSFATNGTLVIKHAR